MAEFGRGRLGGIIAGLRNLFGLFSGGVSRQVKRALEFLRQGLLDIGEETYNFIGETRGLLARLVGPLVRLWRDTLAPLFAWLRARFVALRNWLARVFGPLLGALEAVLAEWDRFVGKWIRPILDFFSITRLIFGSLARLGIKWAGAIDEKLGALEHWIRGVVLDVREHLNRVSDVIDRVVTFDLLLQRVPLLRSLDRDRARWLRLFWNTQIIARGSPPIPPTTVEKYRRRPVADDVARLAEFTRTGGGALAPVVQEYVQLTLQIARGAEQPEPAA